MFIGNSNDTMTGMTVLRNFVGTDVTGTVDLGAYGRRYLPLASTFRSAGSAPARAT